MADAFKAQGVTHGKVEALINCHVNKVKVRAPRFISTRLHHPHLWQARSSWDHCIIVVEPPIPSKGGQPLNKGRAVVTASLHACSDDAFCYLQGTNSPCRESGQRTFPLLVPCREVSLYKEQRTCPQCIPCREALLYKGQRTCPQLVPCREAPLYKEQMPILNLSLIERLHWTVQGTKDPSPTCPL